MYKNEVDIFKTKKFFKKVFTLCEKNGFSKHPQVGSK